MSQLQDAYDRLRVLENVIETRTRELAHYQAELACRDVEVARFRTLLAAVRRKLYLMGDYARTRLFLEEIDAVLSTATRTENTDGP